MTQVSIFKKSLNKKYIDRYELAQDAIDDKNCCFNPKNCIKM